MKRLFWALAAALMMFAPAALAQTAQEITVHARFQPWAKRRWDA